MHYDVWLLSHQKFLDLLKTVLYEDRKVNAQKFETAFYAKPDLRNVKPPEKPKSEPAALDLASLVEQLQKSPELAQALASLISAQTGGR